MTRRANVPVLVLDPLATVNCAHADFMYQNPATREVLMILDRLRDDALPLAEEIDEAKTDSDYRYWG